MDELELQEQVALRRRGVRFARGLTVWREADVCGDELVSHTQAASVLGISLSALGDLVRRGRLTRLVDLGEPNPMRRSRLLRLEVDAELVRRRASADRRFVRV